MTIPSTEWIAPKPDRLDELLMDVDLLANALQEDPNPLPLYSDRGRILVQITTGYPWEINVIDWDGDSSLMWMNEGIGIEYWIRDSIIFEKPGLYVIEGVHGSYIKGTWGYDDDDEEWYFDKIRRVRPWHREWWRGSL